MSSNPNQPAPGTPLLSGVSFYDVSDPRHPKLLGEWLNPGGLTHGMEMDDSYVYVCGTAAKSKKDIQVEELNILNYDTPSAPGLVSRFHIVGQHVGEEFEERNRKNSNGSDQMITCHGIQKDGDRLYVAYRERRIVILDITDPAKPVRVDGGYDYSPPFNGDPRLPREGCCPGAHTFMPAHHTSALPSIGILTDEHFSCPPGFGRVLDITYPEHITLLSTYHIRGVDDQYDHEKRATHLPGGVAGIAHMAEFDHRIKDGNLFYQAWYNQGLRAIDISNPFRPKDGLLYFPELLHKCTGPKGRHTREAVSRLGLRFDLCDGRQWRRSDGASIHRPAANETANPVAPLTRLSSRSCTPWIEEDAVYGMPAQVCMASQTSSSFSSSSSLSSCGGSCRPRGSADRRCLGSCRPPWMTYAGPILPR